MKVKNLFLIAAGVFMLTTTFTATAKKLPKEVKMTKEVLMDKIKGGWAGKTIGCSYGGPTEFKYSGFMNDEIEIPWHEHTIKWWFDNVPGLYDDVYMDLTFVEVFQKEGLDAPIESFANAFAHAPYPLWHANQLGRYNILNGVMPPESGYWHGNEPCHHVTYLYDWFGQPWKCQKWVRYIADNFYGNEPGSLSGNDDCGQMSAWYIFNCLGFYPFCPGSDEYYIGSPCAKGLKVRLSDGGLLEMTTEGWSKEAVYIKAAYLNGKRLDSPVIRYSDIKDGARLHFVMSCRPVKNGFRLRPN